MTTTKRPILADATEQLEMSSRETAEQGTEGNNLARPIMYGSYHPISIAPSCGELDRPMQDVVVGGPLCESGDIFTQEEGGFVAKRLLPVANVGDYLVIECAGAYGFVMSSNYNSKPMAAEVLVKDGQAHLVRQRQSYEDLLRGEVIPQ